MPNALDDLHRLISYQQAAVNHPPLQIYDHHHSNFSHSQFSSTNVQLLVPQSQSLTLSMIPGSVQAGFSDRMWEWNALTDHQAATKDYGTAFK